MNTQQQPFAVENVTIWNLKVKSLIRNPHSEIFEVRKNLWKIKNRSLINSRN